MGLGCDQAMAFEDPPDGGDRGHLLEAASQVVGDAVGTGVVAGSGQLLAERQDGGLSFRPDLVGAGVRTPGARLDSRVAPFAKAAEQLEQPDA